MQTAYVDKYEQELRLAMKEASRITVAEEYMVPYMEFVGATRGKGENFYYYKDKNGNYYYESEMSKSMRIQEQNRRKKGYRKKKR